MCSPISRMRALGVRVRVLRARILASCCGGRIAEIGLGVAAVSSESDPGSEFPTRFGMPSGSCEERTLEGVVLRSRLVASISCTNSRGERKDPCTSPDRSLACKGAAACGGGCPESLGGPGFLWMPTRGGQGSRLLGGAQAASVAQQEAGQAAAVWRPPRAQGIASAWGQPVRLGEGRWPQSWRATAGEGALVAGQKQRSSAEVVGQ